MRTSPAGGWIPRVSGGRGVHPFCLVCGEGSDITRIQEPKGSVLLRFQKRTTLRLSIKGFAKSVVTTTGPKKVPLVDQPPKIGGSKKEPPKDLTPTLASQGISKKESMTWQKLADIPAPVFEKKLIAVQKQGGELTMCSRCNGWLVLERVETREGRIVLSRCIVCGFRDDPLMHEHKRHRPEPFRAVPQPARGRNRSIGQRADRRS